MAMLTGTIECKNCKKNIRWWHQLAQPMSAPRFDVDTPPKDARGLSRISNIQGILYRASVSCPNCDEYNEFEFQDTENIVKKSGGQNIE